MVTICFLLNISYSANSLTIGLTQLPVSSCWNKVGPWCFTGQHKTVSFRSGQGERVRFIVAWEKGKGIGVRHETIFNISVFKPTGERSHTFKHDRVLCTCCLPGCTSSDTVRAKRAAFCKGDLVHVALTQSVRHRARGVLEQVRAPVVDTGNSMLSQIPS